MYQPYPPPPPQIPPAAPAASPLTLSSSHNLKNVKEVREAVWRGREAGRTQNRAGGHLFFRPAEAPSIYSWQAATLSRSQSGASREWSLVACRSLPSSPELNVSQTFTLSATSNYTSTHLECTCICVCAKSVQMMYTHIMKWKTCINIVVPNLFWHHSMNKSHLWPWQLWEVLKVAAIDFQTFMYSQLLFM